MSQIAVIQDDGKFPSSTNSHNAIEAQLFGYGYSQVKENLESLKDLNVIINKKIYLGGKF